MAATVGTNHALPSTDSNNAAEIMDPNVYDEEQVRLMNETCIILNEIDEPIGTASKIDCHLITNIDQGLLHRAFSCFLFDRQGRLLLQQRANEKITFPGMWTNTCCSHPLATKSETGSDLATAVAGVKRAAQRKLDQELGISACQLPLHGLEFLTRIHYKAASDGVWGEHEIDYILFIQAEVAIRPNPNEVRDTRYVSKEQLMQMLRDENFTFTPWFTLICQDSLFKWWEDANKGNHIDKDALIRRMY